MEKLDLTKKYKRYYTARTKPEMVEIEPAQFLSMMGKGDPSDRAFADRIQALYATAYAVKFIFKGLDQDFTVPKLECLWWFDTRKYGELTISETPKRVPRSEWEYRLLIRMPEYVTRQAIQKGIQTVVIKKQLSLADTIELYEMTEGSCVQMLHLGPFATEPETLEQMHEFMQLHKLVKNGLHHEIYLSDFNKTAPDKLKTILREPVK